MKLTPRTVDGMTRVGARQWRRLETRGNPFLDWAFLTGLEASGSVAPDNGWQPFHLCLYEGETLVAAAPSYLKAHSSGEFVFDWAWADAYHRNQLDYYPKLLTAVPWTPVAGPRLLVARGHPDPDGLRRALIDFALDRCKALGLSSWHCNFVDETDLDTFRNSALLARTDCQFHWHNRGYEDFSAFLASLKSKKRKNIRHERRQVHDAGIHFMHRRGGALNEEELAFIHHCYRSTFHAHGNFPALNLDCFRRLARAMDERMVAIIAMEDDSPLAMSLYFTGAGTLYGRYWGTLREVPGLHFETAYYQGIEYCIEHGLQRFESGAQGEHKLARGFEPAKTRSFHYIAHPGFRVAIEDYLRREGEWLDEYRADIDQRRPFRVLSRG